MKNYIVFSILVITHILAYYAGEEQFIYTAESRIEARINEHLSARFNEDAASGGVSVITLDYHMGGDLGQVMLFPNIALGRHQPTTFICQNRKAADMEAYKMLYMLQQKYPDKPLWDTPKPLKEIKL